VNSPDVEENRCEKPVLGAAASIGGGGSGGSSGGGGSSCGGGGGSSVAGGQIPNPAWVSPVPSWYQSSEVEGGMLPVPEDSIFEIILRFLDINITNYSSLLLGLKVLTKKSAKQENSNLFMNRIFKNRKYSSLRKEYKFMHRNLD
jgi:hypothetical protein